MKKLTTEFIWSIATKGITLLLLFGANILLARFLGVEKFSQWAIYFALLNIILTVSYFGINQTIQKNLARIEGLQKLSKEFESLHSARVMISFLIIILLLIIGLCIQPFFNIPVINKDYSLIFYSSIIIFLSGITELFKYSFNGLHIIKNTFFINISEYGIKLFGIIFLIQVGILNFSNILIVFIISLICSSLVGYYQIYKILPIKYIFKAPKIHKKRMTQFHGFLLISIGYIIITEIDVLMLGHMSTYYEVSAYATAKQLISYLPHISITIAIGFMPVFAKFNKKNKKKLSRFLYKLLLGNTLIFSSLIILIFLFGEFIFLLLYGEEYSRGILSLYYLTPYLFLYSTSVLINYFLDYTNHTNIRIWLTIGLIILNIILNFLFIPLYGSIGAAIATGISYLFYLIGVIISIKKIISST